MADETSELIVESTHNPDKCTGVLNLGGPSIAITVECQLPRHRGRHTYTVPGTDVRPEVTLHWRDPARVAAP